MLAGSTRPRSEIQLTALQGCWENVLVPNETYIVRERTVTKLKQLTNEESDYCNVLVIDQVHDRVQWGLQGKLVLKWGLAEEAAAAGLPEEVYWVQPEEADIELQDIDVLPVSGAPKRWRWRRADASKLLDEALAELPPVARVVSPPAQSAVVPPKARPPSRTAQDFVTPVPPTKPPPMHLRNAAVTPVNYKNVIPVPPSKPPPPHLMQASQTAASDDGEVEAVATVVKALQGTWTNALDKNELYEVNGLDATRYKAGMTKTFRFRWNLEYRCIEWGLGKYYLQGPCTEPMQTAVWLPSSGQGRSFSWERPAIADESQVGGTWGDTTAQWDANTAAPQSMASWQVNAPRPFEGSHDHASANPRQGFWVGSVSHVDASQHGPSARVADVAPQIAKPGENSVPQPSPETSWHGATFTQMGTSQARTLNTPRSPATPQQASQPQSVIPPSGLVNVGRPPLPRPLDQPHVVNQPPVQPPMGANTGVAQDLDAHYADLFNKLVENERMQLQQQQQQFPQAALRVEQQRMAAHMQQQMQEQQLLHFRRQLEQQQQWLTMMHAAAASPRASPY